MHVERVHRRGFARARPVRKKAGRGRAKKEQFFEFYSKSQRVYIVMILRSFQGITIHDASRTLPVLGAAAPPRRERGKDHNLKSACFVYGPPAGVRSAHRRRTV